MKKTSFSVIIARSAVLVALALVFLFLTQAAPTMDLALIAAASICIALVVAEFGPAAGFLSYAAASVLSFLMFPGATLLFILFFGWYPILKCLLERIDRKTVEWIIKLLILNALYLVIWFLFNFLFTAMYDSLGEIVASSVFIFVMSAILVNTAFILYDVGLSRVLSYYIRVIMPKIRKK